MRRSLALLPLLCLPTLALAQSGTALYVCAHPDDCLLFMNPNLYNDITADAQKTVVVYLTSGDAGLPFNEADPASYPLVRERASIDATEWMADVGKDHHAEQETQSATIHDHLVTRVSYANTVSYFLRLPDGNFYGNGFGRYGNESLRKLKSGEITSITPIDNQPAYTGWPDLVAVLSGILAREAGDDQHVTLHLQDPDTDNNTNDHSDHTTGASAMMEALEQSAQQASRCYRIYNHIDYAIAEKPINLEGAGLQNKAGGFAVLTATQRHFLDSHNWDEGHTPYLTRNYYTTITLPNGCDTAQ